MADRLRQKIITHVCLWAIIGAGAWFVFQTLPPVSVFSLESNLVKILLFSVALVMLYDIIRGIYIRIRTPLTEKGILKIIKDGDYGKCVHPTCNMLVLLAWGAFFLYPNLRFFALAIWMSLVLYFWIKLEEKAIMGKNEKQIPDDTTP